MHYLNILLSFLLTQPLLTLAQRFDSIYSVHTDQVPMCPPNYSADAKYIGCCWGEFQTITSATGPDGSMSPGCCYSMDKCTGPPPIMYDWTTDSDGRLVPLTPTVPAANPSPSITNPATSRTSSSNPVSETTPNETSPNPPSQTSPSPTSPPQTSEGTHTSLPKETGTNTPDANTASKSSTLSPGEIAGIVTGALTVIIAALGLWKYDVPRRISNKYLSGKPEENRYFSKPGTDIEAPVGGIIDNRGGFSGRY